MLSLRLQPGRLTTLHRRITIDVFIVVTVVQCDGQANTHGAHTLFQNRFLCSVCYVHTLSRPDALFEIFCGLLLAPSLQDIFV